MSDVNSLLNLVQTSLRNINTHTSSLCKKAKKKVIPKTWKDELVEVMRASVMALNYLHELKQEIENNG